MYNSVLCAVLFAALLLYRLLVRRSSPIHELRIAPADQQHWLWGHEYAAWSQETNVKHSPHSRWAALLGPVYRIKAPLFSPDVVRRSLSFLCCKALRLHAGAVSSRTDRVALEDDMIPLGKTVTTANGEVITSSPIKAGQVIPISVLNTDPEVCGPDTVAHSWGVLPTDQLPRGPYANVASFLDGPRNCLGWRLAILDFKVMLAILIRDFALEGTAGAKVEQFRSTTTKAFVGEEAMMPLRVRYLGGRSVGQV
ncbi:hypothetical protein BDZ89DRAFT_1070754 [Hymenopellis radicata]|nr:hypothetical protein BDZ89DRAFT_1070754 [Hymenopellis radicata]